MFKNSVNQKFTAKVQKQNDGYCYKTAADLKQ